MNYDDDLYYGDDMSDDINPPPYTYLYPNITQSQYQTEI